MSMPTVIYDGRGKEFRAGVSSNGQLITAPIAYNETYFNSMSSPNTAYNFIEPQAGCQFVIDGIIFSSDKNVSSTNGAVIEIYEADSIDSILPSKNLFILDIGRLDKGSIGGLNVITNTGIWINGKTDDATTNITVIGYYIGCIPLD